MKISLADANPCTKVLDSQHSHSRSVDHASDAMIESVCLNQRDVSLKEVHSLNEYHGSLEQCYGKIARRYVDFTIRHYGSATTVVFHRYEV